MDTPTEPKEVIAHEFDQDINTHPPPKLKRTRRERGTKLNITMDTATELQPSEPEEVITHEFGKDINTQPPAKLKRTIRERGTKTLKRIDEGVVKRIDEGVKKNTHWTHSDSKSLTEKIKKNLKRSNEGVKKNTHLTHSYFKSLTEEIKKPRDMTLAHLDYLTLARLAHAGVYVNNYVTV